MLGQAGESFRSPWTLDVFPASMVHLYVDDVKALHERARTAGADVTELEDATVGDRRFTADVGFRAAPLTAAFVVAPSSARDGD